MDRNGSVPEDGEIERCLRRVVRSALDDGNDITVNSARALAESELGLDAGFFKNDQTWKARSKDLITAAVEDPVGSQEDGENPPALRVGKKRKSEEPQPVAKRDKRRKKRQSTESDFSAASDVDDTRKKSNDATVAKQEPSKTKPEKHVDGVAGHGSQSDAQHTSESKAKPTTDATNDESEFSDVIDEAHSKNRRQRKSSPSGQKAKPVSTKVSKHARSEQTLSPDEEIKRLQSWLLKCGVRKLWHRELAPYHSTKDKIRHLRDMLTGIGMTGRYSAEKARSIKEARELESELAAAKEFDERWGHGAASGDESSDEKKSQESKTQPRARNTRPKGLVDLGDSDDEEDSGS